MNIDQKSMYATGDIVSFKMVNGEELVAKMEMDCDKVWIVNQPLMVVPVQSGGLQLIPPMMSVLPGQEFRLPKSQVVLEAPAVDQVADHYREVTTDIKAVRKPGIILG